MHEILFRGKRTDNGKWAYGYYIPQEEYSLIRVWYTDDWKWNEWLVSPRTIGQYTGMTEFVMTDKSFNGKLFEGDIVEVWGWRRPKCYNPRSQYDGDYKVRAVIKWSRYKWILDYDNEYNKSLSRLRGKEEFERVVDGRISLGDYGCFESNVDWQRKHNSHYKWHDIINIGNIYDNPELLEAIK